MLFQFQISIANANYYINSKAILCYVLVYCIIVASRHNMLMYFSQLSCLFYSYYHVVCILATAYAGEYRLSYTEIFFPGFTRLYSGSHLDVIKSLLHMPPNMCGTRLTVSIIYCNFYNSRLSYNPPYQTSFANLNTVHYLSYSTARYVKLFVLKPNWKLYHTLLLSRKLQNPKSHIYRFSRILSKYLNKGLLITQKTYRPIKNTFTIFKELGIAPVRPI